MKSVTRACGALSLLSLAAALSAPALATSIPNSFAVTVLLTPVCTVSTPPSTLTVAYTDQQIGSATGFTTFQATCTQGVAYDLSLTDPSTSVAGLTVTQTIQDTPSNVDVTATVIAQTGAAKSYRVLGTIAGGGTGTCNSLTPDTVTGSTTCAVIAGSNTLTLTY